MFDTVIFDLIIDTINAIRFSVQWIITNRNS